MLTAWYQLMMDRAQASVSIRENSYQSAFVYPMPTERKASRTHSFGTAVPYKSKMRGIPMFIEHLAGHHLKISFRSPVSCANVSAIQTDNRVLTRAIHRLVGESWRGFLEPPSDLHCAVAHCVDACLC
jgi:hypothetical protein